MRTIFVTIYDGDTEKVILHPGVVHHLLVAGHRVVLLVRGEDRIPYYKETYRHPSLVIESLPPSRTRAELLWHHISWNSVPSRTAFVRRRKALAKTGRILPYLVRSVFWLLGHLKAWRTLLRFIYGSVKDDYARELFEKYKPDLVFAPNMFSPSDFRILRAAKQRGITTVTTAKSWDVMTSKAFTRVIADRILAFNEPIKEEIVQYGDYKPTAVVVTGFPQFDSYVDTSARTPREVFFKKLGLDPAKRTILFVLQGDWLAPYTHEVLSELDNRIEEGAFREPTQILARLHPKYRDESEKLTLRHGVLDRPGTLIGDSTQTNALGDFFAWTFSKGDVAHLADSLFHADVVVNTVSTTTLDALANDKPNVLVGYDGRHKPSYWDSVERQYEREYFKRAMSYGAIPLARSADEMVSHIDAFLRDRGHLQKEREAMAQALLYKHDGGAAKRAADAILSSL